MRRDRPSARLDLRTLLAAVEDAPPFSATDVLGERLASLMGRRTSSTPVILCRCGYGTDAWSASTSKSTLRSGPCAATGTGFNNCRWSRPTASCSSPTACWSATTTRVDIETMVATGAEMHPRGAVQHLTQAILEATGGKLNDDATASCIDWHGGPARERTTSSGANQ
jgi:hypothetical protein